MKKRSMKKWAGLAFGLCLCITVPNAAFAGQAVTVETAASETAGETASSAAETGEETASETMSSETEAVPAGNDAFDPGDRTVPEGVSVDGMDLAGLTAQEASAKISDYIDSVLGGSLTLKAGEETKEIAFADIGIAAADQQIMDEVSRIGTQGNLIERYKSLADTKYQKKAYELSFSYDQDKLKAALKEEAEAFNSEVQEPSLVRHGGEFILTDSKVGRKVDVDATVADGMAAMGEGWHGQSPVVDITAEETKPSHTSEELAEVTDLLGSYSTSYWSSSSNRIANIANGASLIDETVLYPGESFSFLSHVEPFTTENGYYQATGYSGGKVVPSTGGGICQVSTTLYNAVLRAELEVVDRSCHGLTVSYVDLAEDATVSEGSVDFVFRNNLENPIYIEAFTYEGEVYVRIYGKEYRPASRTIEFESVTDDVYSPGEDVISYDNTLPAGYEEVTQSAHQGYAASLYKIIYENGEKVDTQLVNTSRYASSPRYVTVGTYTEPAEDYSETEGDSGDYDISDEEAADAAAEAWQGD